MRPRRGTGPAARPAAVLRGAAPATGLVLLATAVLAVAFLISGCGGDGSGEGDGSASGASQPDAQTPGSAAEPAKVRVVPSGKSGFNPAVIYQRLSPGVVTITSLFGEGGGNPLEGGGAQGSGFVVTDDGHIATNAHVVTTGSGKSIRKAREVYVQFSDGNQVPAKIVGYDPNADVGVVKVDPEGLKLVRLQLGTTGSVQVGEPVAAIGSPFGEEGSLSIGVVSAKNRAIKALTDFSISDAIQTDAAINSGNSGGPLLDARGRVIGINSQIRSSGGGSVGVGFAVPVDQVKRSIERIRSDGKVRYAYIGVSSQALYPQLAKRLGMPVKEGAVVAEVVKDGPADRAGIKGGEREVRFQASLVPLGSDVITAINGRPVTREDDFTERITRFQPGDVVTLRVYRGGDRREVKVTLGERPADLPKG